MQNNKQKKKSKIPTETQTREKLIIAAKLGGFEDDLLKIFARYDNMLRGAKTREEAEAIGIMGVNDVNKLMNTHQGVSFKDNYGIDQILTYNGKVAKIN